MAIKFRGFVIDRQPRIQALFEVKALKVSKVVDFLVDTGAKCSAITEKEAIIMGIDLSSLPYFKRESVGFGGLFRNRVINRQVILTFKSNKETHQITCGSFMITTIPPNITGEEREKLIRYTPNVLGMDVLRNFKTVVTKDEVELVIER